MQPNDNSYVKYPFASVLITSTTPDCLNSNLAIRDYVANGFSLAFPEVNVVKTSVEIAADMTLAHRPNLVLAVGGLVVDSVDYWALRRACDQVGAVLAFWLHDDPYEFDYAFKVNGVADVIFTNDLWTLEHYQHPNVYHLPLAGCESTHFRPIHPEQDRAITAFFCGVGYPNRITIFRQAAAILCSSNTVVMGEHWTADLPFARNQRLSPDLFSDYVSNSLITFNIGRDFNLANRRYAITPSTPGPRTFEVALSGSAQLFFVDSLEIEDYFEPNSEIILFDSVKEIQETLQHAIDEPEWVINIAQNAQAKALQNHCYQHRVEKIVQVCA